MGEKKGGGGRNGLVTLESGLQRRKLIVRDVELGRKGSAEVEEVVKSRRNELQETVAATACVAWTAGGTAVVGGGSDSKKIRQA